MKFLAMTQEHESRLFSKLELYLVYLARAVSCTIIYAPLSNNTLTKWFIIMSGLTCFLSIYGHYLTMVAKAKHRFSISLADMAYIQGFGRSSLVFISFTTAFNFVFNTAIYLNLISRTVIGLNCQFAVLPSLTKFTAGQTFLLVFALGLVGYPSTLFVITFKNAKWVSKAISGCIVGLTLLSSGIFFYVLLESPDWGQAENKCLANMVIKNTVILQHNVNIELLTIFYMLPLVNFLFLNSAPYSLPMHQRLRPKDEKGFVGFNCLAAASLSSLVIYTIAYLLANLASGHVNQELIPLMFQYVLGKTTYFAWPLLILVSLVAALQCSYDIYMSVEHMLVLYKELRFKSYSTRLQRFEKLRHYSNALHNIETGEMKA